MKYLVIAVMIYMVSFGWWKFSPWHPTVGWVGFFLGIWFIQKWRATLKDKDQNQ